MTFILFISIFTCQRLVEMLIAARNEKWLRAHGAIEYGQKHYPIIIAIHTGFIISMIIEAVVRRNAVFEPSFFSLYILLILGKIWIMISLGKYWNTRIFRIPGMDPVNSGLYKYFKHPNYFIVVCEFIVVPFTFQLFYTAFIFTVLNGIILNVRIHDEDLVWEVKQ